MTKSRLMPSAWPITLKVPLLVVGLMVGVSTLVSERVLNRLARMQQKDLQELTATYLDSLSSSLQPHVLREDVWEVFDILDRTRGEDTSFRPLRTVVANGERAVLAASDPRWLPVKSKLPKALSAKLAGSAALRVDEGTKRAYAGRKVVYQGRDIGFVFAEIDIAPLLAERQQVFRTLVITNVLLTLLLAAIGYTAVRRMLRPVRVLTDHLDRGRRGRVDPIAEADIGREGTEFGRLFRRYNALIRAVSERETFAAKLAEEEKLASLGRLASGMAHEINNPLGGMFNALDTLKRHGEAAAVRKTSLRLLEQGLTGIRDVVRSALLTYRPEHAARPLQAGDLEDMRLLVLPEARRKRLTVDWQVELPRHIPVPAGEVRQIVLNLLLNAIAAADENGRVGLDARLDQGHLAVTVDDSGPGLPPRLAAYLHDKNGGRAPIEDTGGLGLWMVRRLVRSLDGEIGASVREGRGTHIAIHLPLQSQDLEARHVA